MSTLDTILTRPLSFFKFFNNFFYQYLLVTIKLDGYFWAILFEFCCHSKDSSSLPPSVSVSSDRTNYIASIEYGDSKDKR